VLISASEKLETKTVLYELKSRHPVAFWGMVAVMGVGVVGLATGATMLVFKIF
jgi:hypothetical protein